MKKGTIEFKAPIEVVDMERTARESRSKESLNQLEVCRDVLLAVIDGWIGKEQSVDEVKVAAEMREVVLEVENHTCKELYEDEDSVFRRIYDEIFPAAIWQLQIEGIPFALRDQDAYSAKLLITPEKLRNLFYTLIVEGVFGLLAEEDGYEYSEDEDDKGKD